MTQKMVDTRGWGSRFLLGLLNPVCIHWPQINYLTMERSSSAKAKQITQPGMPHNIKEGVPCSSPNMARMVNTTNQLLTKKDIADLECRIIIQISNLIDSTIGNLKDIKESLRLVKQTVEEALEIGISVQEKNQQMREKAAVLNEKVLDLESHVHAKNLRFYGILEGEERNIDLCTFIASWMSLFLFLHLEEGITPLINTGWAQCMENTHTNLQGTF